MVAPAMHQQQRWCSGLPSRRSAAAAVARRRCARSPRMVLDQHCGPEKAEGPVSRAFTLSAPSAHARKITPPSDARRQRPSAPALRKPRDNETLDHLLSVVDAQVCHHVAAPFKPLFCRMTELRKIKHQKTKHRQSPWPVFQFVAAIGSDFANADGLRPLAPCTTSIRIV